MHAQSHEQQVPFAEFHPVEQQRSHRSILERGPDLRESGSDREIRQATVTIGTIEVTVVPQPTTAVPIPAPAAPNVTVIRAKQTPSAPSTSQWYGMAQT
jgi:hypothetical protein